MGNVTFISLDGESISVEATPGASVMQIATANGIEGIIAECGGSMSCATCHVYVDEDWMNQTGGPGDGEIGMLEFAEEPGPTSRLSCQIQFTEALDGLIVRIPENQ